MSAAGRRRRRPGPRRRRARRGGAARAVRRDPSGRRQHQVGEPRRPADRPRPHLHRRLLQLQGDELLHRGQLRQHPHPDGRDGDARLRRRLRPPARRDRSLDQLRGRDRRRRGCRAPAGRQRAPDQRAAGDACRHRHLRGDRLRTGLDRRAGGCPVVRRHARRLPDLAGRDPAGSRGTGLDHHPGPLGQLHGHLRLQPPGRLADRGR